MSLPASDTPDRDAPPFDRPQRPWILPSNRKLRHLQGIALRNLAVTPSPFTQVRGKTIDDDNLPNTLQTPEKSLAQWESRSVHHSRSATDLKSAQPPDNVKLTGSENEKGRRKDGYTMRRRSTLPWSGVSPVMRQTRLENIAGDKMADIWFSLHCEGMAEPVYTSEVVEKAMNPNFQGFDLTLYGPAVSRQDQTTLKFWARTSHMREYFLLLELQVNLSSLQYIGKTLEQFYQPLPPNCVVFQFPDGMYASLTDVPPVKHLTQNESQGWRAAVGEGKQSSSSYDALMRLANLDDCIQDALATRERLEAQMNGILQKNQPDLAVLDRKSQAQERLSATKKTVTAERNRLRQSVKHRDSIVASLKARREAMEKGRQNQGDMQAYLTDAKTTKESSESLLKKTTDDSMGQIRRICEDLLSCYPIEPIPGNPLAFTIANLYLPNSHFVDIDKDSVAAALGYTSHIVYLLSFYISVPLPYPVQPYLSNSYIHDTISVGLSQRTFPLYPVNTHYRFEYGVFLLNKDVEYLMNRLGLRVLDVRHTLPNIKYLLYMLTAGTSGLPARKTGGIRGLLSPLKGGSIRGGGDGTPASSRRGSEDSLGVATPMNNNITLAPPSVGAASSSGSVRRFQSPSPPPPPHKLNGSASGSASASASSRGWQVRRDGQSTVTTMPTAATATAGTFVGRV